MKRLLSIFICLIFVFSIASCEKKDAQSSTEKSKSATAEADEIQKLAQEITANYNQAYLDFLKDKQESHRLFALVFIDNDDIPELYLKGSSEAEGDMICSFKNGSIIKQQLNRTGGGKYTPRSGDIFNQNGNMGYCYTNVYKLSENGFSETFNALSIEKVEHLEGGEYNLIYEYFIAGTPASETEYNNAVNASFDSSRAVRLDESAVPYEEIVQQLEKVYGFNYY